MVAKFLAPAVAVRSGQARAPSVRTGTFVLQGHGCDALDGFSARSSARAADL